MTLPSAATSNARPGSIPLPGVSTTRARSVPLADTPTVLAPVAFRAQALGSLMRIRCSDPTGTSVRVTEALLMNLIRSQKLSEEELIELKRMADEPAAKPRAKKGTSS